MGVHSQKAPGGSEPQRQRGWGPRAGEGQGGECLGIWKVLETIVGTATQHMDVPDAPDVHFKMAKMVYFIMCILSKFKKCLSLTLSDLHAKGSQASRTEEKCDLWQKRSHPDTNSASHRETDKLCFIKIENSKGHLSE